MKKKIALGLVVCLVGLSLAGCGKEASPVEAYTQWTDKVHMGDTAEQVRQAMGIEINEKGSAENRYWYDLPIQAENINKSYINIEFDGDVTSEQSKAWTKRLSIFTEKGVTEEEYESVFQPWVEYFDDIYGVPEYETNQKLGTTQITWKDETGEYEEITLLYNRYDQDKEILILIFWYGSEYDPTPEGW